MRSSHKIDVRLIIFSVSRARFVMHNKIALRAPPQSRFLLFFYAHPDGCLHFPFSPPFNMTHQHMDHDLYSKKKRNKKRY